MAVVSLPPAPFRVPSVLSRLGMLPFDYALGGCDGFGDRCSFAHQPQLRSRDLTERVVGNLLWWGAYPPEELGR